MLSLYSLSFSNLSKIYFKASITVLPVTQILSFGTFSLNKFFLLFSVGAKCHFAIFPTTFLLNSSGKGADISYVRKPASI